jgi:hypothetical protein
MTMIREHTGDDAKQARITALKALGFAPAGYVILYHCDVCDVGFDVLSKTRSASGRTCELCHSTVWPTEHEELWPDEGESHG